MGAEFVYADRQTDGRTEMTKLIVAFCSFAKASAINPPKFPFLFCHVRLKRCCISLFCTFIPKQQEYSPSCAVKKCHHLLSQHKALLFKHFTAVFTVPDFSSCKNVSGGGATFHCESLESTVSKVK